MANATTRRYRASAHLRQTVSVLSEHDPMHWSDAQCRAVRVAVKRAHAAGLTVKTVRCALKGVGLVPRDFTEYEDS